VWNSKSSQLTSISYFYVGRNINYFTFRFCIAIEYVIGNITNFILEFFETLKCDFSKKYKNRAPWCPGPNAIIRLNVQYTGYWYWEWISIFLFGCVRYSKLILDIEVECCFDGKSDELHSYEILIIQPLLCIVKMYATVTAIFVLATKT
jgi:hypothetical protein